MELTSRKSILDFTQSEGNQHHATGIEGYVDLARLALELQTVVKNLASGPVHNNFHVSERNLYAPIKKIFEHNLPSTGLVLEENVIYKTGNSQEKTDLSICHISQKNYDRLSTDFDLSHLFEIKSIFYNDRLSRKDVEHDIEKLLRCENAYGANCFFVLVGLKNELHRRQAAIELMNSYNSGKIFLYKTEQQIAAYLRQAGKNVASDPHVYVFEVSSSSDKYKIKKRRSGVRYSVFQLK